MKIKYLLAASVVSLSAAATMVPGVAQAQQITSSIQGTVADEDGKPIAGATVVVTDTRTNASRTITTGSNGNFSVTNLTAGGPYTVTASAPGFEGQSLPDVNISVQGATNLGFSLASGAGDVIIVSASRVATTQLSTGPGTAFGLAILDTAPSFNRDIRDVIRIDPRVSLDRDDTGSGVDRVSCLGGNDRGNAFTVDGIAQGDVYGLNDTGFASRSSAPIPYDAIRETQVAFAPFDVDYGNFTGCAINAITKSGTNEYHFGGFYEYSSDSIRGDKVDGTDAPASEPEKAWGAYISGPIFKDRLYLFAAYEHREAGQAQDVGPTGGGFATETPGVTVDQFNEISDVLSSVYGIETGPLVYTRPFKNDRYFIRGDFYINDDHRLEATYQRLEESSVQADDLASSGSFFNTITGLNNFYYSGTESDYYSARLYSQWSDRLSTEIRYSRSEIQDLQDPVGGGEAQSDNPIPRIVVGVDNGGVAGAVQAGPGFSRSANDLQTTIDQYRVAATLEAGNHKIKVGAEWNHADLFNLFVQNANGTLVFQNVDDLREGLLATGDGTGDTFSAPFNIAGNGVVGAFGNFALNGDVRNAAAAFKRDIYSIFAQDDWQVNDALGVTLGLRVDWYDGSRPGINPNFVERYGFPNTTSFSNVDPVIMPRVAFTYDLNDFAVFSGAELRGGVGVFSGGDPLVWFGNVFQGNGFGSVNGDLDDSACAGASLDVVVGGVFTGVPQCIIDSGASGAARGTGDTQSIDPNLKMPSVLRANLGFSAGLDFADNGFFSNWNLNLDYIYSKYRDPMSVVDLSQVPNPAFGLNGYSIDGRPIYAAIDPTRTGCDAVLVDTTPPTYNGVTASCFGTSRDDELMLTNLPGYESHIASIILSKTFGGGLFTEGGSVDFSLGYSYTDAHDRRNMYNSTAGSNFDRTAAFDRQYPAESRGFYSSKHNLVVRTSFKEEFFDDLATRLSATFVARSGRPYSLTFGGSGAFHDSSSGSDNALVYLPTGIDDPNVSPLSSMTAVADLVDWASGVGCAKKYLGMSIPRNTCTNDWYYDLDLSFSQEIPGPASFFGRKDKLKLFATMDNFLNFLDNSWNAHRRRNFAGLQDIASTRDQRAGGPIDDQGRYIITGFNGADSIADDNRINYSSSTWRLKVGISYDF